MTSENLNSLSNDLNLFSEMLTQLQNTTTSLQAQINAMNNSNETVNLQKSKSFDKEQFFSQIGKIQIDSTYIDELREASLA